MPRGQKKRKAGEGKAAASKKIMTEQAAEAMESGKYMWPTGCVKKYLTTVNKILLCILLQPFSFIIPLLYFAETSQATTAATASTATANTATANSAQAGIAADECNHK